jgi:hypothetical protein
MGAAPFLRDRPIKEGQVGARAAGAVGEEQVVSKSVVLIDGLLDASKPQRRYLRRLPPRRRERTGAINSLPRQAIDVSIPACRIRQIDPCEIKAAAAWLRAAFPQHRNQIS